jgi:PPE-repeat protein
MRLHHVARAALVGAGAMLSLAVAGAPAAVADVPPACTAPNPGNTGATNTGAGNTGDNNTGSGNTGDRNVGYGNTGDNNTGDGNTVDGNVGSGNTPYVSPVPYGQSGYGVGPRSIPPCA